jgi:hypothetical protein
MSNSTKSSFQQQAEYNKRTIQTSIELYMGTIFQITTSALELMKYQEDELALLRELEYKVRHLELDLDSWPPIRDSLDALRSQHQTSTTQVMGVSKND